MRQQSLGKWRMESTEKPLIEMSSQSTASLTEEHDVHEQVWNNPGDLFDQMVDLLWRMNA